MRIAFYAPMKPPDHPVPSGDRHMARLFLQAFEQAGHDVELACRLRSRDPHGDPQRQRRLQELGESLGDRLLRRYHARSAADRPQAWFTYHLYYKAPDWVGPKVAARLGIPYLVAEASVAYKRADGPWDRGHRATLAALKQAAAVVTVNPHDAACLPEGTTLEPLKPFLDLRSFASAAAQKQEYRARLTSTATAALNPAAPWLLAVAMMRRGDKLASYRLLAHALVPLQDRPWQLLIVGDGPARSEVEQAFEPIDPQRLCFLGEQAPEALGEIYAASDLFVWPAVNEAYGMALLEAQSFGLPVVSARTGGVPAIVEEGLTGLLTPPGRSEALSSAVAALLGEPEKRGRMSQAAVEKTRRAHDLSSASRELDDILKRALRATSDEASPP